MYLVTENMNNMFFDIMKFIFGTKHFKVAAVNKMAPKWRPKLQNGIVSLFFSPFGHAVHEFYVS